MGPHLSIRKQNQSVNHAWENVRAKCEIYQYELLLASLSTFTHSPWRYARTVPSDGTRELLVKHRTGKIYYMLKMSNCGSNNYIISITLYFHHEFMQHILTAISFHHSSTFVMIQIHIKYSHLLNYRYCESEYKLGMFLQKVQIGSSDIVSQNCYRGFVRI